MGKRNNAKTQNLIAVGIFAMLLFAGANQVGAATIYVSQNSPSPKPPFATWDTAAHTIQEAVDVGSDGDSVLVAECEYRLSAQGTSLPRQGTIIIERSTDLRMWQPIRTNAITGGAFELVEPISANGPPQFFLALITY